VIVDGDPQASDPQQACFPAALLEREDDQIAEPLAADARKWADGKTLAKLKLVSGILGIRLDDLRQREQQRKRKLQAVSGIAILAVAALLFFTIQSRMAEQDARLAQEEQQASAENMLAQFLEQSERLADVADLETRKAFGEVMSSYLAELDPDDLTPESRRQLGVALMNRAVILRAEGLLEQAMEVFQNARQTLQSLVDDTPGDVEALFELSQVEYWIGQVDLDLGRVQEAGKSFQAYAEVSHALHRLQPGNADWTMEAAYAQSNLGNLEKRRIPSNPYLMLGYYQSALELNKEAAGLDAAFESELADSYADLADAWLSVCDLGQAIESRRKNVELADKYFNLNPASNRHKQDYAHSLSGLSWVQQQVGNVELAIESLQQSLDLHAELVEEDPQNLHKRFHVIVKSARMAQLLALSGKEGDSWAMSESLEADIKALMDVEHDIRVSDAILIGEFYMNFADLAYRRGERELADRFMTNSHSRLSRIASKHPNNKNVLYEFSISLFYYWKYHDETLPDDSAWTWLAGVKQALNLEGCLDLNIASRRTVMTGENDEARIYVSRLIERGYHEPEFKRFCQEHGLCAGPGEQ
jgi:tetratricopeptide (TPR) repeat protein